MNAEIMMLIVTVVIGLSLFSMLISKRGSKATALYLWLIQLVVVFGGSLFILKQGIIDTVTSTFGLITILMFIPVLTIKKKHGEMHP